MPTTTLNIDAFQAAVSRAVVEGNRELIAAIVGERTARHDLREKVQGVADKNYELDSEIRLLKGFMVTLVGNGDGSSGMVPRLEKDMKSMGEDIANLASDVRNVTSTVNAMAENVRTLLEKQEKSTGFMAGFTGAKVALSVLAALASILAFLIGRGFKI